MLEALALSKDRTGRQLVAMCPLAALTRDEDGTHRLWIAGQEIGRGPADQMRAAFAPLWPDDWLRGLFNGGR